MLKAGQYYKARLILIKDNKINFYPEDEKQPTQIITVAHDIFIWHRQMTYHADAKQINITKINTPIFLMIESYIKNNIADRVVINERG